MKEFKSIVEIMICITDLKDNQRCGKLYYYYKETLTLKNSELMNVLNLLILQILRIFV
jgi:hypothetical protein